MSGTRMRALVAVVVVGAVSAGTAQDTDLTKPTVPIVQTVGCASVEGATWFLTNAAEPTATEAPFATDAEIAEAREASLGAARFQLIGVAEFLDVNGLLDQFQRADFTARDSVNATGQLIAGHRIAIKGLLIADTGQGRINLTSVFDLGEHCP